MARQSIESKTGDDMTKQQIHAQRAAALETTLALMRTGWKI